MRAAAALAVAVLLVAAGAVAWARSSSSSGPAAEVSPRTSIDTTAPFVPDPREVLAGEAAARWPAVFAMTPSADIVAAAQATCDAFAAGATADEVFARLVAETDSLLEARAFGWLAGTAVRVLCPQFGARLATLPSA